MRFIKITIKLFLTIAFLGFTFSLLALADEIPEVVFEKTFGGSDDEIGQSVAETTDGGFIITGSTYSFGAGDDDVYLIKTDSSGKKLWQQTFGAVALGTTAAQC